LPSPSQGGRDNRLLELLVELCCILLQLIGALGEVLPLLLRLSLPAPQLSCHHSVYPRALQLLDVAIQLCKLTAHRQ
jgi:hypothetical protein